MSVNHPANVGTNDGGLVAEAEMHQQQQDAASETNTPVAAHVAPVKAVEQVERNPNSLHQMNLSLLVTLDLTRDNMMGHKKALSAMQIEGVAEPLNLYSPFRTASKGKNGKPPALQGVVRGVLSNMLAATETVNGKEVVFVGKQDQAYSTLRDLMKTTRSAFEAQLPLRPDHIVAQLGVPGEDEEDSELEFKDVVRIGSWITSTVSEDNPAMKEHNAVLSMNVNSGQLYDSEERLKSIKQIESILERMGAEHAASTVILMGVILDPAGLADPDFRELLDMMLTEGGFELYTRNELYTGNVAPWFPSTQAEVDRELLVPNGDLLLIKIVGDEDADDAEGGEGEAQADAGGSDE